MRKSEEKKILYINTVPMKFDGISMTILNYAKSMNKDNVRIDFLCVNDVEEEMFMLLKSTGGEVYQMPMRNTKRLEYILKLSVLIKREGYEVVHIHGNSATMAIDLLGATFGGAKIRATHSHNTTCSHMKIHKLLKPLFNILYTHGFACGEEAGKWLYGSRPFDILKNATDIEKFKFKEDKKDFYDNKFDLKGKIAIGHVAHFTQQKNHAFLIEAFEKAVKDNPNLILFLIGEGKFKADIENMVQEKQLVNNVIFTGRVLDVPGLLSSMDAMVLPSLWEGLPNVVIEWQAAGIPSYISSKVTEECKLTNTVDFIDLDSTLWAEKMSKVVKLNNNNRVAQCKENAELINAKGYNIRFNANKLKEFYFNNL